MTLSASILAAIAGIWTGCSHIETIPESPVVDKDGNVRLDFGIMLNERIEATTKAVDPDGYGVQSLWLMCFDAGRQYIGKVQAVTNISTAGGHVPEGTFRANIPGTTRHIHFIANYSAGDFDDAPNIGRSDTEIIPRLVTTSGLLCYWGYKAFPDAAALTAFASNTSGTSSVNMLRNQARITYRIAEGAGFSETDIQGLVLVNEYSNGTVAPYVRNAADPFLIEDDAASVTEPTLCIPDDRLVAPTPSDVLPPEGEGIGHLTFEHENSGDNPLSVIFRISGKYYKVDIVNKEEEFIPILRNYNYVVNFKGLPESLGYSTFEGAVNGISVNNVWASIDQELPSVSDGSNILNIDDGTNHIITPAGLDSEGWYSIKCSWWNPSVQKPTVSWIRNDGFADDTYSAEIISAGTGKDDPNVGLLKIKPVNIGTLRYGTMKIKLGSLVRTIELVSCDDFLFTPIWSSSGVHNAKGEKVSLGFTIPDNFPEAFFPLDIKIACNYLDGFTQGMDVIFEECKFHIDGTQYDRDWSHKFLYTVNGPGLYKVDFKTVLSNNASPLEFFIEADNFKTRRMTIPLIDEDREIVLGIHSGTDESQIDWGDAYGSVNVPPIGGEIFHLHFRFKNNGSIVWEANGNAVRIYIDPDKVEAVTTGQDLEPCTVPDPDRGFYYIYTIPENMPSAYYERGISIPFRTKSADCATYIRMSYHDQNNSYKFRSAILTTICNPEHYSFDPDITGLEYGSMYGKSISVPYGEGVPVNVRIGIPQEIFSYMESGFRIILKTDMLAPAPGQTGIAKTDRGYEYTVTSSPVTLNMVTSSVASAGSVILSADKAQVLMEEIRMDIANIPIDGRIKLPDGVDFDSSNPFLSLARQDATRVGSLSVSGISGGTCDFVLNLRTEYSLLLDEDIYVIYSPAAAGDQRIFAGSTTLRELQENPGTTILLSKVK